MKDIKIKRICAYVIDIFIVLILVTLLSQINVLIKSNKCIKSI